MRGFNLIHRERMLTTPTPKRDLLTEISALISSHEIYIATQENIQEDTQNNKIFATKKKEYRKSPLGLGREMVAPDASKSDSNPGNSIESEEAVKYRKYKRNNEIAHHCQKLLKVTAYPSVAQITLLVHQIINTSSGESKPIATEIDSIRSIVLQWFRKRREYLASKVYNVCDELMGDVWMAVLMRAESAGISPLSYDSTVEEIVSDAAFMKGIFHASDLPIKDETNGISFVKRKVKDYFTKLCSKIILETKGCHKLDN